LHFTGDEEANALLAQEPLALLIGFALDQQVPVQTAFSGPLKIKQRLGTLEAHAIATADPGRLEEVFRQKPAVHRFPGSMAKRVQELAAVVDDEYGGHAERVWTGAAEGPDPRKRVSSLPRLGEMETTARTAVLPKRLLGPCFALRPAARSQQTLPGQQSRLGLSRHEMHRPADVRCANEVSVERGEGGFPPGRVRGVGHELAHFVADGKLFGEVRD